MLKLGVLARLHIPGHFDILSSLVATRIRFRDSWTHPFAWWGIYNESPLNCRPGIAEQRRGHGVCHPCPLF